jgi:hypothetical protein
MEPVDALASAAWGALLVVDESLAAPKGAQRFEHCLGGDENIALE